MYHFEPENEPAKLKYSLQGNEKVVSHGWKRKTPANLELRAADGQVLENYRQRFQSRATGKAQMDSDLRKQAAPLSRLAGHGRRRLLRCRGKRAACSSRIIPRQEEEQGGGRAGGSPQKPSGGSLACARVRLPAGCA